jgi:arylsulfatase A-like enzyme
MIDSIMHKLIFPILAALLLISCSKSREQKPNIIYFLADDLGYGEVGVYGQEKIKTPNMDLLAENGMLFTQHYSGAPVCAPARYVLLTGQHTGHAFIRGNDEWKERGDVWDYEKACLMPAFEGQRPIPEDTPTLGKQLKKAGYKTAILGKWGLGAPETEGVPNLQGFDYFYGFNCQRQAHNLYPPHLWENVQKDTLDNKLVIPHTKLDSLQDPLDESSYALFNQKEYAPELIHRKAEQFIIDNRDDPFFLYYASPLPHLPLQAPKAFVDQYRTVFGDEEPYVGDQSYFPSRYPRATYAAMISYLDYQLGALISLLKEQGIYENTVIIVSSDNGPTYLGGVDFDYFESSKPFANGYGRTKGFVYEGGIRVPMIVSWPNKVEAGSRSEHLSVFYDMMPTICELAGAEAPEGIDGISFKNTLLGEEQLQHNFLYWEFPSYKGQQAVRMGNWKGIRKNIFDGNLEIELYDLRKDTLESNNIAAYHPDIVRQIEQIMKEEHEPSLNERFKIKQIGDK